MAQEKILKKNAFQIFENGRCGNPNIRGLERDSLAGTWKFDVGWCELNCHINSIDTELKGNWHARVRKVDGQVQIVQSSEQDWWYVRQE